MVLCATMRSGSFSPWAPALGPWLTSLHPPVTNIMIDNITKGDTMKAVLRGKQFEWVWEQCPQLTSWAGQNACFGVFTCVLLV